MLQISKSVLVHDFRRLKCVNTIWYQQCGSDTHKTNAFSLLYAFFVLRCSHRHRHKRTQAIQRCTMQTQNKHSYVMSQLSASEMKISANFEG